MQFLIKNVPTRWLEIVRDLAAPGIVNIWQASGQKAWRSGEAGDIVLFRPEKGDGGVAGYGFLYHVTVEFASQSWRQFGRGNGAVDYNDLLVQIGARRSRPGRSDPVIGNILISGPVFFPAHDPFRLPDEVLKRRTRDVLASGESAEGQQLMRDISTHAVRRNELQDAQRSFEIDAPANDRNDPNEALEAAFRSAVTAVYRRRCAVTRQQGCEVVFIEPVDRDGTYDVSNGLLLRTDLAGLFKAGLIAFDQTYTLLVSPALALRSADLYRELAGLTLHPPNAVRDRPGLAHLDWHFRNWFKR